MKKVATQGQEKAVMGRILAGLAEWTCFAKQDYTEYTHVASSHDKEWNSSGRTGLITPFINTIMT